MDAVTDRERINELKSGTTNSEKHSSIQSKPQPRSLKTYQNMDMLTCKNGMDSMRKS